MEVLQFEDGGNKLIEETPNSQLDNLESLVVSKHEEPTITFSPDKNRFSSDSANCKSRNSSIAKDFELGSGLSIPKLDSNAATDAFEDLLNTANSVNTSEAKPNAVNNNINNNTIPQTSANFALPVDTCGNTLTYADNTLVSSANQQFKTDISSGFAASTTSPNSNSVVQLQRKLEKQIAQASAIAAAISASGTNSNKISDEDTEFGSFTTCVVSEHPSSSPPRLQLENENANQVAGVSSTSETSNEMNNSTSTISNTSNSNPCSTKRRKPENSVKFQQESEVEIISRSSRIRVPGSLIPPERLAVPNKTLSNSNRKHRSFKVPIMDVSDGDGTVGDTPGRASESKPLVQWDSDESEEEMSFFPEGKSRGKLTDNMSVDNMSLCEDEEDLHLSPPRPMSHKCPCDPREWIYDHLSSHQQRHEYQQQCQIA